MDLYARVNILDGRAVRLPKGDIADAVALDADPVARAQGWVDKGVDLLHIVDLDAAANADHRNRQVIADLIESVAVRVQVAGGIRSAPEVDKILGAGAWRVVIGTMAIRDQVLFWDICRDHPGQVVAAFDVTRDEELVVSGWTEHSGMFLEEALIEVSSAGAAAVIVTEAKRDALVTAPNHKILIDAMESVAEPVIAGGGVGTLDELRALRDLSAAGRSLGGVIVGREITEGRFSVEDALALLQDGDAKGE